MPKAAQDRLQALGWLSERAEDFQQAVLSAATVRRYGTGEYTHHIGDAPGGIYCVQQGSFAVLAQNAASSIVLGHVMRRGGWFGQGPLMTGRPRALTFRAMEPSSVLYLSLARIDEICRRMPQGQLGFATLTEYNSVISYRIISELLIRRSDQRIAAVLLRLLGQNEAGTDAGTAAAADPGADGGAGLPLTQADLAEMANVSRHTANAVLGQFEH
ncbi:Crp/Fnr family transcriptional regulator, partial [Paracoccus siganidrum]